jgi:DNA-binding transcriptional MerR regulator
MEGETPWTLEELSARVKDAVEAAGLEHQKNGQVSEVPNARTIRYYATIGVLDRPRLFGRTAMYGQRHLEQIVAIKRLQAEGLPLTEVQKRLLALDDDGLKKLASVPAMQGPAERPAPSRREKAFWGADVAEAETMAGDKPPRREEPPRHEEVPLITGIQLSDGVTLCFPAAGAIDDDDREALRAALQPVVEILRARGLLKDRTGE